MIGQTLQAAVGRDGEWEDWFVIEDEDHLDHALGLVEKHPSRWRIVEA